MPLCCPRSVKRRQALRGLRTGLNEICAGRFSFTAQIVTFSSFTPQRFLTTVLIRTAPTGALWVSSGCSFMCRATTTKENQNEDVVNCRCALVGATYYRVQHEPSSAGGNARASGTAGTNWTDRPDRPIWAA